MFNEINFMIEDFFRKESFLLKAVGSIATIGALWLNIPTPTLKEAGLFLANVQVFWLLVFTILLSILFVRLIGYLIKAEIKVQAKYNLFAVGTFSLTVGIITLFIIWSLWGYILKLYIESLVSILKIVVPGMIMAAILFLNIFMEKRKEKFTYFSTFVVDTFSLSVLMSIAGISIQEGILGYFSFWWLYAALPINFFVLLVAESLFVKLKGKNLFDIRK